MRFRAVSDSGHEGTSFRQGTWHCGWCILESPQVLLSSGNVGRAGYMMCRTQCKREMLSSSL